MLAVNVATRSLYRQLADDFATSIRDGTLKAGERVPSVRELSRDRGLSLATVVHAYEVLEAGGLHRDATALGLLCERGVANCAHFTRSFKRHLENHARRVSTSASSFFRCWSRCAIARSFH